MRGLSGRILRCLVVFILAAELWRLEPDVAVREETRNSVNKVVGWIRSRHNLLVLPPHVRGRNWSSDGGPIIKGWRRRIFAASASFFVASLFVLPVAMVVEGGCGAAADGGSWRLWSDEACRFSSISSTVHGDLMKSLAKMRPFLLLVCSSTCSTSDVRPLSKLAVAVVHVGIEASGEVPATVFGDGKLDFLLDGGEREGLNCNFPSFSKVLSALSRDLCVISRFMGSFVKLLYTHCME